VARQKNAELGRKKSLPANGRNCGFLEFTVARRGRRC